MNLQADIQIENIDAELSKIGKTRVRASLFNLIIFAQNEQRANELRTIAQATVEKFPCRILFIRQKSNVENHFHARLEPEPLNIPKENLCCDQILIEASADQLSRVPYLIMSYIVPDVPVHLLWGQDPLEEKIIMPHLQRFATRLIYDAGCTSNIQRFSQKILSLNERQPNLECADIDWIQTGGWRNIVRQVFDSPASLERLDLNKGIQIRYNAIQNKEAQPLYLTAWLAAQLQWRFLRQEKNSELRQLAFHNGTNEFTVTIRAEVNPDFTPGSILQIEVASNDDHFFFISPVQKLPKVIVHISTLDTCDLPFTLPMPTLKPGFSNVRDLFYSPISPHYRYMLQTLAHYKDAAK